MGEGEWSDVPISKAVAASGALPMIYEPVEIKGREFIDGGILSTTNIDVAIERGAKFVVVINPLVPYVNDFGKTIPTVTGSRVQHVSDMGLAGIGNQVFRMMSHDRLHRAVEIWEERYPGVDIVLIEPELDDALMFGTSILDYKARLEIAKHGFESVTLKLARDYDRYRAVASATASRSPSAACATRWTTSSAPRRAAPAGAVSSSRRPRRSCGQDPSPRRSPSRTKPSRADPAPRPHF